MKYFIFPVNYIFITELCKIYVREQFLFLLRFPALILFFSRRKSGRKLTIESLNLGRSLISPAII